MKSRTRASIARLAVVFCCGTAFSYGCVDIICAASMEAPGRVPHCIAPQNPLTVEITPDSLGQSACPLMNPGFLSLHLTEALYFKNATTQKQTIIDSNGAVWMSIGAGATSDAYQFLRSGLHHYGVSSCSRSDRFYGTINVPAR